jgi:hypothetical protein
VGTGVLREALAQFTSAPGVAGQGNAAVPG